MTLVRRTFRALSISDFPASRHGLRKRACLGMAVGVGALALLSVPAVAHASTSPSTTTFKFSGAVQGTLTQSNGPCESVGGYGGQFAFSSKLRGSSSDEWTVNVNNLGKQKNGGTFKKFGGLTGNGVSVVLQSSNGTTDYYWASKSGVLTITPTSGSLKILLVPDQSFSGKPGKGTIHLTGSWGCEASS